MSVNLPTTNSRSQIQAKKKRFKLDLRATLKKMRFDPVQALINELPRIEDATDKAKILLEINKLIFPAPKYEQPKPPRTKIGKQTNIQVNAPQLNEEHLRNLREIAAQSEEDSDDCK